MFPGSYIADFRPVQVIRETIKPKPLRSLLKMTKVYERSSAGMSSSKKHVDNLLRKYDVTFSSSGSDLGRAGIIYTSNYIYVKQAM